jgi:hypothetical protein
LKTQAFCLYNYGIDEMKDVTPRCPHCSNLCLVGTLAGKCVAVCTYCDNGFAVAGNDLTQTMSQPAQIITRQQFDKATEEALLHINKVSQGKQDDLLAAESRLPEDSSTWTPQQQQDKHNYASQRMLFAGVLQGAASYRDVVGQMLGLPKTTITSAPIPTAPQASVPAQRPVETPVTQTDPKSVTKSPVKASKAAKTAQSTGTTAK